MKNIHPEIMELAKNDAAISYAMHAHYRGDMTYKEALEHLVIHFSKTNKTLTDELIRFHQEGKPANIILERSRFNEQMREL